MTQPRTDWGEGTVDMARLDCVKCGRKLAACEICGFFPDEGMRPTHFCPDREACRCVNATPGIRRKVS